jgi:hypothetical protein
MVTECKTLIDEAKNKGAGPVLPRWASDWAKANDIETSDAYWAALVKKHNAN